MDFPKWKYHPLLAALIVQDEREEGDLGEEWRDTPFPVSAPVQTEGQNLGEGTAPAVDQRELFGKWLAYKQLTDEEPAVLNLLFDAFTARGRQGDAEIYAEVPATDDAEQARQKLLEDAKELGLSLHPRTGADKIQAAIDKKLAEG